MSAGRRERVLDPIERTSEVLFGLIMVLSFTCSMSVAESEREEVRAVLIGAIGCNLAWGLIDAVMYLTAILTERGRHLAVGRAVRASPDAEHGRALLASVLPEPMGELFDERALEDARAKLLAVPELRARPRLAARDLVGAFGVFLLVFLSTFPVVVPLALMSELHTAMRVSNAVAIVMLYFTGHVLARYAGLSTVRTGLAMVALGVALVGLTIALGG